MLSLTSYDAGADTLTLYDAGVDALTSYNADALSFQDALISYDTGAPSPLSWECPWYDHLDIS